MVYRQETQQKMTLKKYFLNLYLFGLLDVIYYMHLNLNCRFLNIVRVNFLHFDFCV